MSGVFFAYWQGFTPTGPEPLAAPALRLTPAYVDIVALAFALPAPGSAIDTDFLTSKNSKESILADAAFLRSRGQKVVMSLNGNPNMLWNDLDPTRFANNVKALAAEWNLDGIDLDNEDPDYRHNPDQRFVDLIKATRDTMGDKFTLSYPAFLPWRDGFLAKVRDELTLVNTMAYWNDATYGVGLYQNYADLVGPEKVCIGVKPGLNMQDQSTPIAAVPLLAAYQPTGARKAGMMMYSLSLDVEPVTGQPRFSWAQMVHDAMARTPPAVPGNVAGPA